MVHRIQMPDGTHRQSSFLRWTRTAAYALMSLAGLLLLISDLVVPIYGVVGDYMAGFLLIGGALSAFGAATGMWFGEFTGLPLLGPAFGVFGVLVWNTSEDFAPWIAAANLSLLFAIAIVMAARWRVVYAIYRLAAHLGKDDRHE